MFVRGNDIIERKKINKYLKVFCFLIIGLLTFNFINTDVSAATRGFAFRAFRLNGEIRWRTYSKATGLIVNGGKFISLSDGIIAYCIEPGLEALLIEDGVYDINTNTSSFGSITGLSDETLRDIELISFFGYGYNGDTSDEMYMATQLEIWERISPNTVSVHSGDFSSIDSKRVEIRNRVNQSKVAPSFNNSIMEVVMGQTASFTDTNGVLSGYSVYSCSNCSAKIEGNTLKVTGTTTGNAKVRLVKIIDNTDVGSILYTKGTYQKLMTLRDPEPFAATLSLKVNGGKIKITKVDSETDSTNALGQATLVGAKYEVINSDNKVVSTLTIGSDMTATTNNLPTGTYTIKEIQAPNGYYLNDTIYTATIESGDTINVTVEDDVIKGKIKVIKKDSETNSCIASGMGSLIGAKYEIRDHNNILVDTITIGDDCSAISKSLPYGKYTIKEVESPEGYYLDTTTYSANINSSDTIEVTSIEEIIKGRIEISKKDSETNSCKALGQATLVGAKFNIYDHNNVVVDTIVIGDDCSGISKYLPYGKYTIKESETPEGYYLNNDIFTQFISEKSDYLITVTEDVIKNYISILKQYDYVNGNTTFLNAEVNITFEIYYPDGTLYDKIITDKNGYATLDIPYGVWKFHQVNSTTGFEKIYDFYITVDENSEKEQYYNILNNKIAAYLQIIKKDSETGKTIELADTTFRILNTDTNQYVSQYVAGKVYDTFKTDDKGISITYLKLEAGNYKIVEIKSPNGYLINENGVEFSIGEDTEYNYTTYGAFVVVEFNNTPIKGQVEIIKNGEQFIIDDGTFKYDTAKLEGVKFNLYADEDIKTSDGNYLYYNKGDLVETLITDKFGYVISKKLPLGKYYLVEVETNDNYVLDTTEYHFELTEINNKTEIVYEKYETLNYLKKGDLVFTKTDLVDGSVIPNVEINIFNSNDELVFYGMTDDRGEIVITDLLVGKYYIVEVNPAEGYILNEEKVYFEILENNEVVKTQITNEKITSTLKINKVDNNQNNIAGVKFGIYDLNDNLICEKITNEDGYIEIELEYGKYYFQEISTLEQFVINSEKIYFEVIEDGAIIEKTIVNNEIKSTLEILKIDSLTKKPLENVKIGIYNADTNELLAEYLTDKDGKISLELSYGNYYISEIETLEDYILSEEKIYFDVKNNNEIIKIELENEKEVEIIEVPDTSSNSYFYLIPLSLFVSGIILIIISKKKNKKV